MAKKKADSKVEEKVEVAENLRLPKKDLFRIDEVARYFEVSDRTIRLWIEHGHLKAEKIVGVLRVSRESIASCRFKKSESIS